MNNKIFKTKCNWCGKEIECPEDALKLKQMCYDCFKNKGNKIGQKTHIDIPTKELEKDAGNFGISENET